MFRIQENNFEKAGISGLFSLMLANNSTWEFFVKLFFLIGNIFSYAIRRAVLNQQNKRRVAVQFEFEYKWKFRAKKFTRPTTGKRVKFIYFRSRIQLNYNSRIRGTLSSRSQKKKRIYFSVFSCIIIVDLRGHFPV